MDVSFVISHWGIPEIISVTETLEQKQTSSYELAMSVSKLIKK